MALLDIVRWIAILQLVILIVLVIVTLGIKFFIEWHIPIKEKRRRDFLAALKRYPDISKAEKKALLKHLHMTFTVLNNYDDQISNLTIIVQDVFLPTLKERAGSKLWYDRYMVSVIYQYVFKYQIGFDALDKALLIQLIHDRVAIVSMHAVIAASLAPDSILLNEIITVYHHLRLNQVELLNLLLNHADSKLGQLVASRLESETDPITRGFCYVMLQHLPVFSVAMPYLNNDIKAPSLHLALNAIAYLNYSQKPQFKKKLLETLKTDQRWQIRARCLKFLGRTHDEVLVKDLESFLGDEIWWVKFRAAEALNRLGPKGAAVLQKHQISLDEFTQNIAKQRLLHQMR